MCVIFEKYNKQRNKLNAYFPLALKHSERRAFQCRPTFDAEHSSGYYYGRMGSPGDECKVKLDEVGRFLIITSNGMPDHDHSTRNIRPQNIELSIPKHPTLLSVSTRFWFNTTCLQLLCNTYN